MTREVIEVRGLRVIDIQIRYSFIALQTSGKEYYHMHSQLNYVFLVWSKNMPPIHRMCQVLNPLKQNFLDGFICKDFQTVSVHCKNHEHDSYNCS